MPFFRIITTRTVLAKLPSSTLHTAASRPSSSVSLAALRPLVESLSNHCRTGSRLTTHNSARATSSAFLTPSSTTTTPGRHTVFDAGGRSAFSTRATLSRPRPSLPEHAQLRSSRLSDHVHAVNGNCNSRPPSILLSPSVLPAATFEPANPRQWCVSVERWPSQRLQRYKFVIKRPSPACLGEHEARKPAATDPKHRFLRRHGTFFQEERSQAQLGRVLQKRHPGGDHRDR